MGRSRRPGVGMMEPWVGVVDPVAMRTHTMGPEG
jgi:hypothetical protein